MHRMLLLLVSVSACAADTTVDVMYDPCSPLTISVAPDLGADEASGVQAAIEAWARVLPVAITIGTGPRADAVLPLHFETGDTFYRAMYWDKQGTISISRDHLAPAEYGIAIAHELGHAFGLLHVDPDERPSVMNVGNVEVAPNEADAAAVRALWTSCSTP